MFVYGSCSANYVALSTWRQDRQRFSKSAARAYGNGEASDLGFSHGYAWCIARAVALADGI